MMNDLGPLCLNCHAVIHRKVASYSIEELRKMIKAKKIDGYID